MNLLERITAPTPRFFKRFRLLGLLLTAISGALLGSDTGILVQNIATHLATAGTVIAAVSQVTVDQRATQKNGKTDD